MATVRIFNKLRGKRGPGELVDFQGSLLPSSRMVHPHVQEVKQRWQEAYMGEQEAPGLTET